MSSDSAGTFRSRLLWVATGWAVVLGIVAGFGALIFLGAVDALTELVWPDEGDIESFFGGRIQNAKRSQLCQSRRFVSFQINCHLTCTG